MNIEKRNHCVSVRLNTFEMERLNELRGKFRRGSYLRHLFNDAVPAQVPTLNQRAYAELARSASNLNQIAHHLNINGHINIQEALDVLRDFRLKLIGAI